jgi:hypothetical protein
MLLAWWSIAVMGFSDLNIILYHYLCLLLRQYSVWLRAGRSGFDPRQGQRIFPLAPVSRPALGPTQPPVQWVLGVLSPGVKRSRGVMLTTHLHLMPRSWMSRSYTSSPPQAPTWRIAGLLYCGCSCHYWWTIYEFLYTVLVEVCSGKEDVNLGEVVDGGLLGCNVVWSYGYTPTFRRNIMPSSPRLKCSMCGWADSTPVSCVHLIHFVQEM